MKKESLLFVPLVGKTSACRQKEGLKLIKDLPLLPRLTAVLPPQGREKTTHGFTLIELLVVVLIIGILAAVALPQYQKAVWKSRMVQMLAIRRAFLTAQQTYFLEHGVYAKDLSALPINLNIPARFYAHCNTEDGHITIQDNKVGLIWDFYPATEQRAAKGICAVYNTASQASVLKAACQSVTQDPSPSNWTSSNQTAYHLYL